MRSGVFLFGGAGTGAADDVAELISRPAEDVLPQLR